MAMSLPNDPYEGTTEAGDHVALMMKPIDEYHEIQLARDSAAGAICSFIGTTRDNFQGKTVTELEYEAYPSMALKTMQAIVKEARDLSSKGAFSFSWPEYPQPPSARQSKGPQAALDPPSADLIPQVHSTVSSVTDLSRISLIHRLGVVPPKESSISIVVSSPHRKEAFRACEWILEEVKKRVEIWKREVYALTNTSNNGIEPEVEKAWKENFPK